MNPFKKIYNSIKMRFVAGRPVVASSLKIQQIQGWKYWLDSVLLWRLTPKFNRTVGDYGDGVRRGQFMTFFVSAFYRQSVVDEVVKGSDSTQEGLKRTYVEKIVPALQKINENFKILGHLSLPSALKMAVVDLTEPWAVFAFPVVEFEPNYQAKLDNLGLSNISRPGLANSVGDKYSALLDSDILEPAPANFEKAKAQQVTAG